MSLLFVWFLHQGYYGGSEDYYGHNTCSSLVSGYCGYDFRDGESVDYQDKGNYSTHVFAQRAIDVVNSHDPNKVRFVLPFTFLSYFYFDDGPFIKLERHHFKSYNFIKWPR